MKLSISILSLMMLCSPLLVSAQKTSNESETFSYIRLPNAPSPVEENTFAVSFSSNSVYSSYGSALLESVRNRLDIEGFEKTSEGSEDVLLKMSIGPVRHQTEHQTINKVRKNDDGTETPYKVYAATLTFTAFVQFAAVWKSNGEVLKEINQEFTSEEETGTYGTRDGVNKRLNSGEGKIYRDGFQELAGHIVGTCLGPLDREIGYTRVYQKVKLASGKGRKHDYAELDQIRASALAAFDALTGEDLIPSHADGFVETLNAAITVWNIELENLEDSKKARISPTVGQALLENIYKCYFYMDDFENASATIDRAEELFADDMKKFIRNSREYIENRQEQFEKCPRLAQG